MLAPSSYYRSGIVSKTSLATSLEAGGADRLLMIAEGMEVHVLRRHAVIGRTGNGREKERD